MGLRVLVADDAASFRDEVARALAGHQVVEAANGAEALENLGNGSFPLVVTARELEGASGIDLLKQVRSRDPDALVVVTLDAAQDAAAQEVLRLGAHDTLVKPCDEVVLDAVLRRALQHIALTRENDALLNSLKRNVEALGLQNQKLEYLATRDGLTGLYNHRYFRETFEVELSRCRRYVRVLSLIFVDIDHFKSYNDTHGHLAGDQLLSAFGEVIMSESRKSTVVARYGGEEFVLLVPESDHQGALCYAEKIRALVESHSFDDCGGGSRKITVSMGVAGFPQHGTTVDDLIKHADNALYRAKAAGRNTVCG